MDMFGFLRRKDPIAPGTSPSLRYPVLVAGTDGLRVMDTEQQLTTTRGATGIHFGLQQLIDSGGILYKVLSVKDFGRKAWFLDLGTSDYRIHLTLKKIRTLDAAGARKLLTSLVTHPDSSWSRWPSGSQLAAERVQQFQTLEELLEGCRSSWQWH